MEKVRVFIDDGTGSEFDSRMHECRDHLSIREGGDLTFITKHRGTAYGRPCVMVTFSCQVGGGPVLPVQAVTTIRALKAALKLIIKAYPNHASKIT